MSKTVPFQTGSGICLKHNRRNNDTIDNTIDVSEYRRSNIWTAEKDHEDKIDK